VLEELGADVLCLQEVWASERENQAEALAGRLGMRFAWAASSRPERWRQRIDYARVDVGVAILSRWPLVDRDTHTLPESEMPTLHAVADTPAGRLPVFTVHLEAAPGGSAVRCRQVSALAAYVAQKVHGDLPPVVAGDFNAEPDSDEVRLFEGHKTAAPVPGQLFVDAWRFAKPGAPGWTWDRSNPDVAAMGFPDSRIDYVFVGMPLSGRGRVLSARRFAAEPVEGVWGSDHCGVLAVVE
jgi:endonuclease/exonuclease/phosphatase family metal-dependent hydrolase